MATIHETAIIGVDVQFGANVTVGAYCVLEDGVVLGDDTVLAGHVILRSGTVLGRQNKIDSFTVVGGLPQDLGFDRSMPTGVITGDRVELREGVTIHRATKPGGNTRVGDDVYLMAGAHVAHDCDIASNVILANTALIGGHSTVGPNTFISGGTAVHQNTRIGTGVMMGGNATATYDVPPYCMIVDRNGLRGLNVVGLRRRETPADDVRDLKRCYKFVYREGDPRKRALAALASPEFGTSDSGRVFLEFFGGGTRGFVRPVHRHG